MPRFDAKIGRAGVAARRVRSRVDQRATLAIPRRLQAARVQLVVHEPGDLLLGQPRTQRLNRCVVDLTRRLDGRTDTLDLSRGLAATQRADDRLRRNQPAGKARSLKIPGQHLIQAMPQPVGKDIVGRIIDGQLFGIEPLKRSKQTWSHRLIVGDNVGEETGSFRCDSIAAANNCDAPAGAREKQRTLPGQAMLAVDQRQHRVAAG